jgi:hypothetical protein
MKPRVVVRTFLSSFASLAALAFLLAVARPARADISDRPRPPSKPERVAPPDAPPQPKAVCGVGVGMVVLGFGLFGAWRFAPRSSAEPG